MAAAIPERVGNFRIVEKLGQGGMGMVFRAMHSTLERPVALKLLPAEFANHPEYVMRFLREARTIATLQHENIIQVYDAGEQDGQYYIAMELVDGENLLKYAEGKGRLPEQEGLALLLQAAKGLVAAHAKGLVHRDIKPENLLLGKDNVLRIGDFGLVMESTSTTQLTVTGACLGTPMYMSPEQADGEQADARTDLYSLGVTFYRILTGQAPFTSTTVMNLLFKHKFEAPPDPRSLRPELSQDVAYLLLHLLAKKREDRPQSAQALIEMIEGIKCGRQISPPPVFVAATADLSGSALGISTQLTTSSRATRKKILPAAAMIIVLIVGIGLYLFHRERRSLNELIVSPPVTSSALYLQTRGDAAFATERYAEALEIFREALAESPQNPELKTRLARTEKAMKFKELMRQAELAESRGELDEAATRYSEAVALDEGETAKKWADRVYERIASNATMPSSKRDDERKQQIEKARAAEKDAKYEIAADGYARAAALTDGAARVKLADNASECRRQHYLAQGATAESQTDYATAATQYSRALGIKADPAVSAKLDNVQKLAANAVENNALYAAAMRAAQTAITTRDYQRARAQLDIAINLKPNNTEAIAQQKEIDRLEAAAKPTPPRVADSTIMLRRVATLLADGKDEAALAELNAGLTADPDHADLKKFKTAIVQMRTSANIYAELQKISSSGQDKVRDMRDEDDDEQARKLRRSLLDLSARFTNSASLIRPMAQDYNYESVRRCLETAKNDAKELANDLSAAAQICETRAEKTGKKSEVDIFGIVKIGGGGKKADKYDEFAKIFRKLATEARALIRIED
ncbi:MAG: protein kinase [Planctomycetota bacterium]